MGSATYVLKRLDAQKMHLFQAHEAPTVTALHDWQPDKFAARPVGSRRYTDPLQVR